MPMQIETPNFAAQAIGLSQRERGLDIASERNDLAANQLRYKTDKLDLEKVKATREQRIEAYEFALNLLGSVSSQQELNIAKQLLKARYPEKAPGVDALLPAYDPKSIKVIQNTLRTQVERDKLKAKETELKGFGPGTTIFRGGQELGTTSFAPQKGFEPDVFRNRETGDQIYVTPGSEIPPGYEKVQGSGVTVNMPGAAPSGERESLNKLMEFQSQLERIQTKYDPAFVGRLDSVKGGLKELTGVGADKKESVFRQIVKDIGDTLLRLRSGAQINEQEYKRMQKLVPTLGLPDEVFLARLDSLANAIKRSIQVRQSTMSQSGYIAPSYPSPNRVIIYDSEGNRVTP